MSIIGWPPLFSLSFSIESRYAWMNITSLLLETPKHHLTQNWSQHSKSWEKEVPLSLGLVGQSLFNRDCKVQFFEQALYILSDVKVREQIFKFSVSFLHLFLFSSHPTTINYTLWKLKGFTLKAEILSERKFSGWNIIMKCAKFNFFFRHPPYFHFIFKIRSFHWW